MSTDFPFLPPNAVQLTATIEHTDIEGVIHCIATQVLVQTHKMDELEAAAKMAWQVNREAFADIAPTKE